MPNAPSKGPDYVGCDMAGAATIERSTAEPLIAVTGAAGFIGARVLEVLDRQGFALLALVHRPPLKRIARPQYIGIDLTGPSMATQLKPFRLI
jgi:hypothetical protein